MKFIIFFFFDTSNLGDFKLFPPHKYTCIISQRSFCIDFVLTVQHELNYHGNFDFKDFWFLTSQIRMQPKLSAIWDFMLKAVICCQRRKGKLLSLKKVLQSSNSNQFTEAIGILYFNHKWLFLGLKISLSCKTPTFKS